MSGLTGLLALAAVSTGLAGITTPALADTVPPAATTPATVSADALPTVQINGVAWSQVTVGNVVYVTGNFTSARPAGAPAGTNETPRANLLAYDITTGALLAGFNHSLNAQGLVVTASPDGSTVFVGGSFTTVDGVARNRLAAFSTANGSLLPFAPTPDATVRAISATNTTVYAGGSFSSAAGRTRSKLAAFAADTGALLAWAPAADATVTAMVVSPGGSKVIVGGHFENLSGQPAYGLGAVDATTGAGLPWAANQKVRDAGVNAAINSLHTDGTQIYGTGYVFGPGGNLEGTFAANPDTGAITWIEDCHGDSYDTFVAGSVLYNVSHSHACQTIGSFPETTPRSYHRATAFTTYRTGTVTKNGVGTYVNWAGNPAPTQLDWYPTLDAGSFTGQTQAAWSASGNSSYLALGGEFPKVNNVAQQGLVRFAVKALAPNKVGPKFSTGLSPVVAPLSDGSLAMTWEGTYDPDNETLTYKLVRDGQSATPLVTTTANSTFYRLPSLSFTDGTVVRGSTHTYRVEVSDPFGNSMVGSPTSATSSAVPASQYAKDVAADGAVNYWRLGEPAGTTGFDQASHNDLAEQVGVGHLAGGAINGDSNGAASFTGTASGVGVAKASVVSLGTFSTEAWFSTTSAAGGKIIGFGKAASVKSTAFDRHTYLDNAGHVLFGVNSANVPHAIASPAAYNDGQWHHVVASLSVAGLVLYVDGRQVAADPAVISAQSYTGYWRVGGDNLNGWPSRPTSNYLAGNIDDVAVYPAALSLAQVQKHYTDSGRSVTP